MCFSSPHSLILTWLRFAWGEPQGLHLEASGLGGTEVNRLHAEAVKKQKDAADAAAARKRKRKRKEKHDKAWKIAHAEGKPRPTTPESTEEEEGSSDVKINFPDDDEVATGAGSPPVYRGAGDEGVPVTLGEARLTPGSMVCLPLVGAERRSPTPVAG